MLSAALHHMNLSPDPSVLARQRRAWSPSLSLHRLGILPRCPTTYNQSARRNTIKANLNRPLPQIPDPATTATPPPARNSAVNPRLFLPIKHLTIDDKAQPVPGKNPWRVACRLYWAKLEAGLSWPRRTPHYPRTPSSSRQRRNQRAC